MARHKSGRRGQKARKSENGGIAVPTDQAAPVGEARTKPKRDLFSPEQATSRTEAMARGPHNRALTCIVIAGLIAGGWFIYGQVSRHDFVNLDDQIHVYDNDYVTSGMNARSIAWAFSISGPSQWHPLTWLSHELDCELFGLNPHGHHLTSVVLHVAAAAVLFLTLNWMTGAFWPSACVAALFLANPQNVESVAWIAERKNVLSTLFWILTIAAYVWYVRRGGALRYGLVMLSMALGLMSKPMLVTLPCALLLLDFWPLQRWRSGVRDQDSGFRDQGEQERTARYPAPAPAPTPRSRIPVSRRRLLLEKVPLLALALIATTLTIVREQGQRAGAASQDESVLALGAAFDADPVPQYLRIADSLTVYVTYLRKLVWPADLTICIPHRTLAYFTSLSGPALASFFLLAAVTFAAVRWRGRRPYLAVGWFWYLGTLVPVIGILPIGPQHLADRYTYIPMIGVYIAVVWSLKSCLQLPGGRRFILPAAATLALTAMAVVARGQTLVWRDSVTLYEHALSVVGTDHMAHYNLGMALKDRGRFPAAEHHFREALKVNPKDARAYNLLGIVLKEQDELAEALAATEQAIEIDPQHAKPYNNRGVILQKLGRLDEAIRSYDQARDLNPDNVSVHVNLGISLWKLGRLGDAVRSCKRAVQLDPLNTRALNQLGVVLRDQGRLQESIRPFEQALDVEPDLLSARNNLGMTYHDLGRHAEALAQFQRVLDADAKNAAAHVNLSIVYQSQRRYDDALRQVRQALETDPESAAACVQLGSLFGRQGRIREAVEQFERALQIDENMAEAEYNLGLLLARTGNLDAAIEHCRRAVRIRPGYALPYNTLGSASAAIGRAGDAVSYYRRALRLRPGWAEAALNLAFLLAAADDPLIRDGAEAVRLAKQAGGSESGRDLRRLEILAAAYAEIGEYDLALKTAETALGIAASAGQSPVIGRLQEQVRHYKSRRPFRQSFSRTNRRE